MTEVTSLCGMSVVASNIGLNAVVLAMHTCVSAEAKARCNRSADNSESVGVLDLDILNTITFDRKRQLI
jgi:hypothetical protein